MSSRAVYVPTECRDAFFHRIRSMTANKMCFDCNKRNPSWATVSYGVLICLDCSGYHRRLGVHLSFVRSIDMDEWTEDQLKAMQIGGNAEARKAFKQNGVLETTNIETKYNTKGAQLYKAELAKKIKTLQVSIAIPSQTQTEDKEKESVDGLDALVKDISLQNSDNGSVSASSGHFSRTIAKPTNAYGPTAVRGNSSDSSLLQVDRPKVLLGNTGANKVKKSATASFKTGTGGATKLSNCDDFDFDDIPFENAPPSSPKRDIAIVHAQSQIDEDEALARALQQAEEEIYRGTASRNNATFTQNSQPISSNENLHKYKNSKSISSDNFFSSERVEPNRDNLNRFSDAQAISSDMYYDTEGNRGRAHSGEMVDEAAYQLDLLKSRVTDKASKLKQMTSSFFTDLQTRYA